MKLQKIIRQIGTSRGIIFNKEEAELYGLKENRIVMFTLEAVEPRKGKQNGKRK